MWLEVQPQVKVSKKLFSQQLEFPSTLGAKIMVHNPLLNPPPLWCSSPLSL